MNKKRKIIITIIIILVVILGLWISGIIPKQIARISATNYLKKNFPKKKLEYVDIEWSSSFGGYSIRFKDENNEMYGLIMNNKYFPTTLGQGLFGFEENNNMKATIKAVVVEVNDNYILAMDIDKASGLYIVGTKDAPNIEFKKGQEILIYFSGEVLATYPGQIADVGKIEVIKEESSTQIPDNVIRYCYNSRDNVNITISELTSSNISLTITDKNELPYIYAHSYKINKKVKNKDYTGVGQKIGEDTENSISGFTRNRGGIYMARSR